MHDTLRTLLFATALASVCSLMLFGANSFTQERRSNNEQADRTRNILDALNVPVAATADAATLMATFNQAVRSRVRGNLTFYELAPTQPDAAPAAVAVAFSGPGLWGPIKGIIALEPDLTTIRAVRIFKQEETPGLGGEIAAPRWLGQFTGKQIVSEQGLPGLLIRKPGGASAINAVDGISGATMTCDKVEAMLTATAKQIAAERTQ